MNPEDYKFITTLVLGAVGACTAIMTFFIGLCFHLMNTRISALETRMLALEKSMKEFQDEIRTQINLLIPER